PPYLRYLLLAVAVVQAARAAYRLIRALVDLLSPVTVTGTVLDVTVAGRQHLADHDGSGMPALPDLPTHFYVVLDDGSSDVLRPWIINRDVAGGEARGQRPVNPSHGRPWHDRLVRPFFVPG